MADLNKTPSRIRKVSKLSQERLQRYEESTSPRTGTPHSQPPSHKQHESESNGDLSKTNSTGEEMVVPCSEHPKQHVRRLSTNMQERIRHYESESLGISPKNSNHDEAHQTEVRYSTTPNVNTSQINGTLHKSSLAEEITNSPEDKYTFGSKTYQANFGKRFLDQGMLKQSMESAATRENEVSNLKQNVRNFDLGNGGLELRQEHFEPENESLESTLDSSQAQTGKLQLEHFELRNEGLEMRLDHFELENRDLESRLRESQAQVRKLELNHLEMTKNVAQKSELIEQFQEQLKISKTNMETNVVELMASRGYVNDLLTQQSHLDAVLRELMVAMTRLEDEVERLERELFKRRELWVEDDTEREMKVGGQRKEEQDERMQGRDIIYVDRELKAIKNK